MRNKFIRCVFCIILIYTSCKKNTNKSDDVINLNTPVPNVSPVPTTSVAPSVAPISKISKCLGTEVAKNLNKKIQEWQVNEAKINEHLLLALASLASQNPEESIKCLGL